MTNRGLATGVFRAWGIMWSIYVLLALPPFLNSLIRSPYSPDQKAMDRFLVSSQAMSIGCEIVVAVFLLFKGSWLATLVFPVAGDLGISIGAEDLQAVLFSVVGLYFLLDGARYALGGGFRLLTRPRGDDRATVAYLWQMEPESFVRAVGGILAGAIVLLGRGRFSNPWQRVRGVYRRLFSLQDSPDEK